MKEALTLCIQEWGPIQEHEILSILTTAQFVTLKIHLDAVNLADVSSVYKILCRGQLSDVSNNIQLKYILARIKASTFLAQHQ